MSDLHFVNETEWDASDFRKVFEAFNEGVVNLTGGDLEVTAGGTGLSVDVAEGIGFVEGDTEPDQGLYRVTVEAPINSDAFLDGGLEDAHATLPRFDRIIARVYDDEIDSSGDTDFRLEVLTGTPTSGATLANENGAAALPGTAMLLANVVVPAAATSLVSGDLEDQRISALADISAGGPHGATHEIGGSDEVAGLMTADQNAAMDAANAPDAGNPIATMDDVAAGGGGTSNAPEILARDTPETLTTDDFSVDTSADYDGPPFSMPHWAVTGGVFDYDGSGALSSVMHDSPQLDGWVGFKFTPRSGINYAPGLILKSLSQTSIDDVLMVTHSGTDLSLWIYEGGSVYDTLDVVGASASLTPGTDYWMLAKLDGNVVMAGIYDADPIANPETTPLTYGEFELDEHTVTLLGDTVSGYVGWSSGDTEWIDDFIHDQGDVAQAGPPIAEFIFDGATVEDLGFRRARVTVGGAGGGILEALIDAKGDLIAGDAADSAVRVAVGTDGKVLTADSAAASGVSWQTPASGGLSEALLDAVGDLIVASADNTAARLAKGTDGQVLTVDSAEALDLKWADPALILPERDVATYTTGSLADDAAETGTITLAKSFRLLQIDTDVAARVQLYATPGDRTADAARAIGVDPTGDHGVILDFVTTPGDTSWRFAPVVDGSSMEVSPSASIAMRVTNVSGATDTVTVDLTYLATEQ